MSIYTDNYKALSTSTAIYKAIYINSEYTLFKSLLYNLDKSFYLYLGEFFFLY